MKDKEGKLFDLMKRKEKEGNSADFSISCLKSR